MSGEAVGSLADLGVKLEAFTSTELWTWINVYFWTQFAFKSGSSGTPEDQWQAERIWTAVLDPLSPWIK
jgi:hypothetical protein